MARTQICQITLRLPAEDTARLERLMRHGSFRSRNQLAGSILHEVLFDDEMAHGLRAEPAGGDREGGRR
jgi:hypothetical protein